MKSLQTINLLPILVSLPLVACQTLETGGKVVDTTRKEIILSSNNDPLSALPQGSRDDSVRKASERLEEFVQSNPKDVKALLGLAELQLNQNKLDEAEASCRRALLMDVKSQDARRILAQVSIRKGNLKLATVFLTALGGEDSKDSNVINMMGLVAFGQKDFSEAMRLWKLAVSHNAGDISARMNLGVMYLKNKMFQQASTQFERVLKIAPAHQDARLHLAIVEASRGRYAQSIAAYNSILDQDRTNKLALFNLSIAQKNNAMYDDAIAGLKKFIKVSTERSKNTDQAFALIQEINTLKASSGEVKSDDELQELADELASRKPTKNPKPNAQTSSTDVKANAAVNKGQNKQLALKKSGSPSNTESEESAKPSTTDSEIEALERQLTAPAH